MKRRDFHRLCGGLLAAASEQALAGSEPAEPSDIERSDWPRTLLMRDANTPLLVDDLAVGDSWIFHYPYVATPCFLLRLDQAVTGGVGSLGDGEDIVAFSAICSHKMTAPAATISHINYRRDPVTYTNEHGNEQARSGLVSCCSERSIFDPADGARVLSGPAPMPLAAIQLAAHDDGAIEAIGSTGANRYNEFLDKFGFRLALELGIQDIRADAPATTRAMPADEFSAQRIRC